MMVKPAGADDAEDAPPSEHAADPSDPPEEEEDADAMDALLGVGHDLRGAAAAPPKSSKSKSSSSRRSGAAAAPKPPDPSHDMDESAKMLMLLGELGGQEASDPSDHSDHSEDRPPRAASRGGSSRGARDAKNNAAGDRGASKSGAKGGAAGPSSHGVMNPQQGSADSDAAGAQAQGPVGEWLKAEGEARMKMADHRRLIYRWTNAIYRLLGMKIPRGMGSLFDKGEKNKREKFDRFLSYYYGTETFEPGTYWYNNADTIQFFVELVRVATRDRYAPEPVTIQKLFRKKDPTRQASTWIMVQEELDKTDVSAEELRALFEGPPRVENGFPRGRPLLVPIPKNPKGHHKYNNAKGGGGTAGGGTGTGGTGAGAATDRGGDASAPASPAPPMPASLRASSREGGVAGKSSGKDSDPSSGNSAFAAAREYAARAHAAARRQHAKAQARHRSASAQHEAMFGAAPRLDPHDSATARAMNAARRRSALATSLSGAARGFLPLVGGAAGIPGTDFGAVAMAQAAAAAAAPGACEGITLAPSPMKAASPGGQGGARDDGGRGASGSGSKKRHGARLEGRVAPIRRLHPDKAFFREVASAHDRGGVGGAFGSGGDLFRLQHKGDKGADSEGAADRGGSAGPGGASASAAHAATGGFVAAIPPSPTRLVGEILLATLADVAGPAFGMKIAFDPDEFRDELESLDPAAETEEADDRGGDARGARAGGDPPGAGGEGGPAAAAGAPPPWSSSSSSKRSHEHAPIAPSALAAAREGRERLMSLGEEVTRHLPSGDDIITPASSEDPSDRGGFAAAEQRSVRTPREPVVDRTALGAQVDSVLVAAKAAESAWRRHAEALRLSARAAKVSARCDAKLETARDELAGAELALAAAEGPGAALVEPGLRDAMRRAVEKSVAAKKKTFENAETARSRAHGDLERHRAQAATSLRAFKPQYDEVRKRALRLRLAAEERAERQVARALSRAERAAEETAKRAEKVAAGAIIAEGGGGGGGRGGGGQQKPNAGRAGGGDEGSSGARDAGVAKSQSLRDDAARAARTWAEAREAIAVALEGCKTAVEWSKEAIAHIAGGRDV